MKRGLFGIVTFVVFILAVVGAVVVWNFVGGITGHVVSNVGYGGPSASDMECMVECTTRGCDVDDMECRTASSRACGSECGVETEAPEPEGEGEACMQECISRGCDEYDVGCQNKNREGCEDGCGMKGDAPDESGMSAEQLCISNCVAAEDPSMICGNSQDGESGGALCQRCASECVSLYEGPCLDDEGVTAKERECETCEHCYGEPVMGASGEGWDCIIDVKCEDASSEFGDDAGSGPGIGDEGYVASNVVMKVVDGVVGFFKGLFGE